MADTRLVLVMNMFSHALTQYTNFNFNSIVGNDGSVYGFNEDGIFLLDSADSDGPDHDPIDAEALFAPINTGRIGRKRVRRCIVSGDIEGSLVVGIEVDGRDPLHQYGINKGEEKIIDFQRDRSIGNRTMVCLGNVGGSDFSVSGIDVVMIEQTRSNRM